PEAQRGQGAEAGVSWRMEHHRAPGESTNSTPGRARSKGKDDTRSAARAGGIAAAGGRLDEVAGTLQVGRIDHAPGHREDRPRFTTGRLRRSHNVAFPIHLHRADGILL